MFWFMLTALIHLDFCFNERAAAVTCCKLLTDKELANSAIRWDQNWAKQNLCLCGALKQLQVILHK